MVIALRIAAFLAVTYVVIVFLAWALQDRLAFPAPRHTLPAPGDFGVEGRIVQLRTHDGLELSGWYLPPDTTSDARGPALLWFSGNMETVGATAPILLAMRPPGAAFLAIDYRGYGENPGSPSETHVYQDAQAAWRWLASRPEVDPERIAVFGRSIGSTAATWLAVHESPIAVVLDSPFTSARAMGARHYWFLPRFLGRLELDNLARVSKIDVPILILHGTEDGIAPFTMGRELEAAAPNATLVPIEGAGHNDTFLLGGTRYRDTVLTFLAEAYRRDAP